MYAIHKPVNSVSLQQELSLKISPLRPFGAEVVGFNFDDMDNLQQACALRRALIEHKMLLIRNKTFTPEEQLEFTHLFGSELLRAGPKLRHLEEHPEIFKIANRNGVGNVNTGQYWHSDGHYLSDPTAVSVMHIVSATADGATQVVDSEAAYNRLTTENKTCLSRLAFWVKGTGVAHPIVIRHPITGRHCLYVNLAGEAITSDFKPLPQVSKLLNDLLSLPGTVYEHHWRPGDTLIVDNFSTAHRGTHSDPRNLRVMHRTTVTGRSVWWRD